MTDRIQAIKDFMWEKKHHAARITLPEDLPLSYRDQNDPDYLRSAKRLKQALDMETPYFFPGELIAFTRTVPNLPFLYADDEWAEITAHHFIHERGNVSNITPDFRALLAGGLQPLLNKLSDDPYHQVMKMTMEAVLDLTKRYEKAAEEAGLTEIAETLRQVPRYGARTFREALQSLRIIHYAFWAEGDYHCTLGRFDQYMMPYLQADLDAGRETEESAFELLEAFFLSCNRDSDWYIGLQQGDNGQSMVLGGRTQDGSYGYNLLSSMCLKASGELRLIDPKINLRVDQNTPVEIFEEGTQLTKLGLGFPQYENDDVIIPGLMALGYEEKDAVEYAVAACWEFTIPGTGMEVLNIGAMPFANSVDKVIRGQFLSLNSMDELKEAVRAEIFAKVREILANIHDLYFIPSPFLSLFFDGCLEKKRDISLGCKYNNFGLHGTGLAPAADMMAAVDLGVFNGSISKEALLDALSRNFEGYDELHDTLKYHMPKMGNDDDAVDQYGIFLLNTFADAVKGLKNERGGIVRAGTGSALFYISHAAELKATADGREEGVPLPANYAPSLNIRMNGPVSLIKSFTKPELEKTLNGGPLTIEFSDSVFTQEESISKVAQLVRLFVLRGGHEIQLNTINRDRLLDAQAHPENYKNLIVRVWGWSGYFVELDKCYQDHIIMRATLNV